MSDRYGAGIASRVAALCLNSTGSLNDTYLKSSAVRAGVMLDLALGKLLNNEFDSVEIVDAKIDFEPANVLLSLMLSEPERSLNDWLNDRRVGLPQVADELVSRGVWSTRRSLFRKKHFHVVDPTQKDYDMMLTAGNAKTSMNIEDTCTAYIAHTAGLIGAARTSSFRLIPPPVIIEETRPVRSIDWLLDIAVDHIQELRKQAALLRRV